MKKFASWVANRGVRFGRTARASQLTPRARNSTRRLVWVLRPRRAMGHPGEAGHEHGDRWHNSSQWGPGRLQVRRQVGGAGPKVVIITQHELGASGLEALLLAEGHHVLARCTCCDDLLLSLMSNRPDILLLNMVGREAARLISQLRADHRSMSIILMLDERDAITAASLLELDVEGILLGAACASSLLHCVESVCHGRRWVDPDLLRHLALAERTAQIASRLTRREADIAHLISRGLPNKQIARELHMTEGTVKMHLHHIYEKLHCAAGPSWHCWPRQGRKMTLSRGGVTPRRSRRRCLGTKCFCSGAR